MSFRNTKVCPVLFRMFQGNLYITFLKISNLVLNWETLVEFVNHIGVMDISLVAIS